MTRRTVRPCPLTSQDGTLGTPHKQGSQAGGRSNQGSKWSRLQRVGAATATAVIGAAATVAASLAATSTTPANASYDLPPCEADYWVDGMAVERFDNGDFKVVLTPSVDARTHGTFGVYAMWHLVQACVPGLYDELADTIYGQLACHADLSAAPGRNGEAFATGPTWDFESYRPAYNEVESVLTKCSAGWDDANPYGGTHDEAGEWEVYFGVDPIEKSQQELAQIQADRDAAAAADTSFAQRVYVINTGGVGLWTRGGPGYGADRYQVLPDGTEMTLLCQVHSELIVDWMTTDIWDYVRLDDGQEVWVSDAFIKTGSDGQIAPTC